MPELEVARHTATSTSSRAAAVSARCIACSESSPTAITSWTSSVTVNSTNYSFDSANVYRDFIGAGTAYAVNVKVTANLTQRLTVRGTRLNVGVPYFLQVAWNRQVGTASGTLLARMGAIACDQGVRLLMGDSTNAMAFRFSRSATNHGCANAGTPAHHQGTGMHSSSHRVSTVAVSKVLRCSGV